MKDFRTVTLADQVFERLESDIIQGVYPRGEVLTELKLVEQLNVSRTPIREALRRLEQEHLIADTGKGSVVLGITAEDLVDIMDIRCRIEGLASYYAAKNVSPEGLARLRHILDLQEFYFEKRDAERLREIAATDETLRALLGDGVYWLRPPWGFLAPQTAAAVEVPMVYWSLDTEDWRRLDADAVAQDIIDHARDGDIILLHDPYTTSVEAALRAIDALTPQGYRFVTLEELFRQKGVEPEPGKLYIRPDELKRIA